MTTFTLVTPDLYSALVKDLFNPLTTPAEARLHAVIGLIGEYWEYRSAYNLENQVEELGDFAFYMEALRQVCGFTPIPIPAERPRHDLTPRLERSLDILLDKVKKEWAYAATPTSLYLAMLERELYNCFHWWLAECQYHSFTPDEVRAVNYTKLRKRYPEGKFTHAAAQARADKAPGE